MSPFKSFGIILYINILINYPVYSIINTIIAYLIIYKYKKGMFMKSKIVLMALLLASTTVFGRDFLTDGQVITSDVSDSWVKIGQIKSGSPSVNVIVDKNVSITASSYLMIYDNNSITFRGGNKVIGGQISVRENSALYADDTVFTLDQISFMSDGSSTVLKNCTVNTKNFMIRAKNSGSLVLDGTKLTTGEWSGYAGGTHYEDGLFNITLKNGSAVNITGAPSYGSNGGANITLESGSSLTSNSGIITGSDITVGSGCSLDVGGALRTDKALTVAADSTVNASGFNFDKLTIVLDEDFSQGDTGSVDLATIFGSSSSLVMSALESQSDSKLTIKDSNGKEFNLASENISGSTISFEVGSQVVPEPATYAAIFGALALAFAAYRRRR